MFKMRNAALQGDICQFLITRGVEAKVHYPIPIHLQNPARDLGYKRGDFPVCERQADEIITLLAHQHITPKQIDYMLDTIRAFYLGH